jgi:hypothetical protein
MGLKMNHMESKIISLPIGISLIIFGSLLLGYVYGIDSFYSYPYKDTPQFMMVPTNGTHVKYGNLILSVQTIYESPSLRIDYTANDGWTLGAYISPIIKAIFVVDGKQYSYHFDNVYFKFEIIEVNTNYLILRRIA